MQNTKSKAVIFSSLLTSLVLVIGTLTPAVSHGDIVATGTQTIKGKTSSTTMYMTKDQLKMKGRFKGKNQVMIFNSTKKVLHVIDDKKKEILTITEADLKKFKKSMDAAIKQFSNIEKQLSALPKAQREQMKKMLMKNNPSKHLKPDPIKYTRGKKGKVGKWSTTQYIGKKNGKLSKELWVAPLSSVGLTRSDVQVLEKLESFLKTLSNHALNIYRFGKPKSKNDYSGFPMKSIDYNRKGKADMSTKVTGFKKTKVAAKEFALPKGPYKRKTLSDLMKRR